MCALPTIEFTLVRTIRRDANHNAFTDLCRYRGRFYLAFRSCPDGHAAFDTASIVILSSDDGQHWSEAFTFSVSGRDTRDPHFLLFEQRLFVYSGTWLIPEPGRPLNLNDHVGYGVWTDDGKHWSDPFLMEGTYGHYIWRAAAFGDHAYLCARRRREFEAGIDDEQNPETIESAMLESIDGLVWRYRTLFAHNYGDETAFLFEADGSALALVRDGNAERALLCRSDPPWQDWRRVPLDCNVGGPLLAAWRDRYLVGGRKTADGVPSMNLYWLVDDQLHEAAELPSGGDCSYPGFVELDDGRGLLSYYSTHEGTTAIYLTELSLP